MELRRLTPFNWFRNEGRGGSAPAVTGGGNGSLANLHEQIDDLFDQAFRGYGFPSLFENQLGNREFFKPSLDIKESAKAYTINVEMPGVEKQDVDVEVEGDALIIRGEKRQEDNKDEEQYHYVERSYGSFQRILAIPEDADAGGIDASFKDGVLSVTLPRKKEATASSKKVEVK